LSTICMRALSRNPSDRYQSLKAMAVEVEEFLAEAGYADDDSKIASYLATMTEPRKPVVITLMSHAPASSPPPPAADAVAPAASGTQPPPNVLKAPAAPAPSDPKKEATPARAKRKSGEDIAAALANAGKPPEAPNGSARQGAPNAASPSVGL